MTIGRQVQEGWNDLALKHNLILNISGIPPLSHFSFPGEHAMTMKSLFVQLMLEKGFLASTLFYAMYAHQREHIKRYLQATDKAFSEISELNRTGNLSNYLKGLPASQGFRRLV